MKNSIKPMLESGENLFLYVLIIIVHIFIVGWNEGGRNVQSYQRICYYTVSMRFDNHIFCAFF